jgi:hypothetical protein
LLTTIGSRLHALVGQRALRRALGTQRHSGARVIENAVDLLRLILAYCLGERGLRSTAAWAVSIGLADVSNVALLYRLRQCGNWLALLIGHVLAASAPKACGGRYRQHGFELVSPGRKTALLKTYWSIPDRQIAASVVLANPPID